MNDARTKVAAPHGPLDNTPVSISRQDQGRHAPDASPIDRLLDEPFRFEFNQAVRLLQTHLRRLPSEARPVVRFRNTLSLSFPPSEVMSIETERGGRLVGPGDDGLNEAGLDAEALIPQGEPGTHQDLTRLELTPAFMGLLGANGALPLAYTEQFLHRETVDRDSAARAFLDIFQHRVVTLFHEAWRKHRLPLQFETHREDRYLPLVMSLAGLGEPALRRRLRGDEGGVADDALAFYGGLLQRRAVSANHLERVLADYFAVPVTVTEFVGRWFHLADACQAALGPSTLQLGQDTMLGPRAWQRDLRVRVSVGPLDGKQHQRFLPGGPAALALRELLTLISGGSLEFEIRLTLRAADVTCATLPGTPQSSGAGVRLGWDSFLITHPCAEDREEAVYDLNVLHDMGPSQLGNVHAHGLDSNRAQAHDPHAMAA